jgi:hypothetical protein
MVFRLSEQYLIRAEARVQQGKNSDGETDLNFIRERAGLNDTTAANQDDLLNLIYHERQIEMFCEWGNRWLDLKRTDRIDSVMAIVTPVKGGTWKSNWQFYPIPKSQINLNPLLIQNDGY